METRTLTACVRFDQTAPRQSSWVGSVSVVQWPKSKRLLGRWEANGLKYLNKMRHLFITADGERNPCWGRCWGSVFLNSHVSREGKHSPLLKVLTEQLFNKWVAHSRAGSEPFLGRRAVWLSGPPCHRKSMPGDPDESVVRRDRGREWDRAFCPKWKEDILRISFQMLTNSFTGP